jgi:hypothetical protein
MNATAAAELKQDLNITILLSSLDNNQGSNEPGGSEHTAGYEMKQTSGSSYGKLRLQVAILATMMTRARKG